MVNRRLKLSAMQCESLRFNAFDSIRITIASSSIVINLTYSGRLTLTLSYDVWFVTMYEDSRWFTNHLKMVCKLPQNHFRLIRESTKITPKQFQTDLRITENHQESPRITSKQFQTDLWTTKSHWESPQKCFQTDSQIIENCPKHVFRVVCESPQNNFTVVHKSLRIKPKCFQSVSQMTKNHQELLRITPKQFQSDSRINENHPKMFSDWFTNQESLRIAENNFKMVCKSLRIAPKMFSKWLMNH